MPGSFERSKYETNKAFVTGIRVQDETIACTIGGITNDPPEGARTSGFPSARVSGSSRTIGLNARTVTLTLTAAKTGYTIGKPLTIPALTPEFYDACETGETGTYLGVACEVIGRKDESVN
jgi:hypothetical protein